jgi:putative ABC transport system substrate-binding protein
MHRRIFLHGIAWLALPPVARAQSLERIRRIGVLSAFPADQVVNFPKLLRPELEKLGWTDGRTIVVLESRTSEGNNDRLPALAAEVVGALPDVIVVFSAPATRALMQMTSTIPIIMVGVGDPVAYGLVRSYTEPGGNVTGTSYLVNELSSKTLGLLKEIAPRITSVAVFVNPTNEGGGPILKAVQSAGSALGVRIHSMEVRTAADFEPAHAAIRRSGTESLLLSPDPLILSQRGALGRFAADQRLPMAIAGPARFLDAGGLLTYGAPFNQFIGLTARYIDQVLRGANPAKLPIEQPTKFELGVNLKAAKTLDLTIPQSVLLRADQVIQ